MPTVQTYAPVDAVYKTMYATNVELAEKQATPKFEKYFNYIPGLKGRQMQAVELVGPSEAILDAPEQAPTPNIPPAHAGIWVRPRRAIWGRLIPNSTAIKAAVDYNSIYVQEGAVAVRRGKDKIHFAAILGPRLVVQDENADVPVAIPFDTANQQLPANYGAAGAVGLTVKKFVGVMEKFQANGVDVDAEQIAALITAKQNSDLYNELQFTSKDYRNRAVFEEKRVMEFMGCKLLPHQDLPFATAGVRRCPFFCKSGMHYGDAMPIATSIERDPSYQYEVRPFIETWTGATRSLDKYVVDVLCSEV